MAFDGIVTKKIVSELDKALVGGKINKVSKGVNYALNLCISSDSYRINLTTHQKSNPLNAPRFLYATKKTFNWCKNKKNICYWA